MDFDYNELVANLSEEELRAYAAYAQDSEILEEKDPLLKHKFNNEAQGIFRGLNNRYRAIVGGNKIGKTDEMGFICGAICTGRAEEFGINFPHKPPLNIWYCGRDRAVLSDEPLKSIKRYLKPEQYKVTTVASTVQKVTIYAPDGAASEIIFKPYTGEIGIFESGNVHAVFMDEEPPREIFSAIKPKIAVLPGYVFIAMTPDKGMSWTHDLFNGTDPEHGTLVKQNLFGYYQATVFDNIKNFKVSRALTWIRYPIEWISKKEELEYKTENNITYVQAPDTFAEYINQYTFGTNEYRMRVLGHYVSFTGKVFRFDATRLVNDKEENWNTFDLHELPPMNQLKFFGALDYGYNDEFVYLLIAIGPDNTYYVLDEIYESFLDATEQAKKVKAVNDFWGIVPEMIAADNQICNRLPQKDSDKVHITSIKDYYMDVLGDHYTMWRTEEMDKRDPHIKRDAINRALDKKKLRFSNFENRTYNSVQELQRLEFQDGSRDKLRGKDHADAALRIFFGANIQYDNWASSSQIAEKKNVTRFVRSRKKPIY